MAPELLEYKPHNETVDVWALGCIAFELLTSGSYPFGRYVRSDIERKIVNEPPAYKLINGEKVSSLAYEFIDRCLVKDPSKRPSAA